MKRFTVKEMKNRALRSQYNGGFIIEKRKLALKEVVTDTSFASSTEGLDNAIDTSSSKTAVVNKSATDGNPQTTTPTVDIKAKTVQDAKQKIQQANNNPTYKKLGDNYNYQVEITPNESKQFNKKIVENLKKKSVAFTKKELNNFLLK